MHLKSWSICMIWHRKEVLTENNMFFLSWLTARGSGTGSVCLITDTDSPIENRQTHTYTKLSSRHWRMSTTDIEQNKQQKCYSASIQVTALSFCFSTVPVRIDWSTRRVVDLIETIRISAGTLSPTGKIKHVYIYHIYTYISQEAPPPPF